MAKCAIILASHGLMALETLNSASMILGDMPKNVEVISVTPDKNYDECLEEIHEKYERLDKSNGCLIITDIYGGTPANIASYLAIECPDNVIVFSGLNLPVLLEILIDSNSSLAELEKLIEEKMKSVSINITKAIKERMNEDANKVCTY